MITSLRKNLKSQIEKEKVSSNFMNLEMQEESYTTGFAFFPYGNGLINDEKKISTNCIMIVGQDFGTVDYVKKQKFIDIGELKNPTMNNLNKELGEYSKKCFFTNLFMGLRNDAKMIGCNPALKAKENDYLNFCYDFFKQQVAYIKPKAIVVLGRVPYEFICKREQSNFKAFASFTKYFEKYTETKFNNIPIICIPHPSMWNSNLKNNREAMIKLFEKVFSFQ